MLHQIATSVCDGASSAEAVVGAALDRIARENPKLNAFVATDAEAALAAARALDQQIAGGARPRLAGVPVGVKDNIWVAGLPVAQGSRLFQGFRPSVDAIAVERLRRHGAIILGMTNAPEFASKGHTDSPLHGAALHPQDQRLTPGGSSGGSAAAVAAGLVPLALGTDAGGSIRRPAAHVGICGFKPSYGAIPYGPGFAESPLGVSVIGPLAATVEDITLAFDCLAGHDPRDPDALAALDAAQPVAQLRIAYSPRFGFDTPMDPDVTAAMEAALERLRAGGVAIARFDPVWPSDTSEDALLAVHFAGLAAIHGPAFRQTPELFDPLVGAQVERGFHMTGAVVAAGLLMSRAIADCAAHFFSEIDVLIGPTIPCVAWPVHEPAPAKIGGVAVPGRGHAVFTPFFNHARTPALTIPAGTGRDRLPVGLQMVSRRGSDRTLLAIGARFEALLGVSPAPGR